MAETTKRPKQCSEEWLRKSNKIKREPVNSSTIRTIGYDEQRQVMEVEFWPRGAHKPAVWRYGYVDPIMYETVRQAPSIGASFAYIIKQNDEIKSFRAPDARPNPKGR